MTLFDLKDDFLPHNIVVDWPCQLVGTELRKSPGGRGVSF